ncbi:MAG TPA: enoyl-CoA hydratase-related protein [Nocardioides sp.]|nr:enoyl-CoA hydratase-related protein [Nocardioides sp.]
MSRTDPVDVARRLYAALAAGDADALEAVVCADFVGHVTPGLPLGTGGDHEGRDAMRDEVWWQLGRHYHVAAEPEEFHLLDDGRLHVRGHYRGQGRRSGRTLDAEFIHVITVRDDRVARLEQLTDSAAFIEALGEAEPLETVGYRVDEGLAVVSLVRPEAGNAIDQRVVDDLLVVARRLRDDPAVRAVLIRGDGPSLSFGGDIDHFIAHGGDDLGALLRRMTVGYHEALTILDRLDVPVVTAAHGAVAGGGLGLVYAADLVVAAEGTRFVTAFARLGVSGDGGGTWQLARRIGATRAAAAYLLNRPIAADEALAWGLVNEVVPGADLDDRALEVARGLAAGPTRALGGMRRLLRTSWTRSHAEQLLAETAELEASGRTKDARTGIDAFRAQRRPDFEGA